ncbi:DUF1420 domain-containing protein [Candidatus Pelagibacter sp.]|nr:DUF1420 domain-containing protein [Candidatus Pelagibacter sp.]
MILDVHPLLSILSSLLIINGFYNLSKLISKSKYLIFLENYAVSGRVISFFLIVNIFSILLYNFFLLFGINEHYLKILIILLVLIGFYRPYNIQKLFKKYILINTKTRLLLFIILLSYFVISLLPITDSDSLDYHITIPYLSLLNENFFIQKEWFTSQLAGAGEALIIFGLAVNAYKLSSILQFAALLLIIVAILNLKHEKYNLNINSKILICLAILCIPSFLFLTFTAKPQLFAIGTNFVAFLMAFFILPFEKNDKRFIVVFCLICFLCLSATQFKFSFFLSSGIILLFSFIELFKRKLLFRGFFILLFFFIIIVFPREYYDFKYLSHDIIRNFFSPATDDYSTTTFIESLKHGTGNSRYFPYWIFLPYNQHFFSLSIVTEIVGLSVLIFLVNFKFKPIKNIVTASLIFFILALLFGQPMGRFFIEPFLWLTVGSIIYLSSKNNLQFIICKKLVIINSIIILVALLYTIVNFLPGIFSIKNHKNILEKYANGYNLYQWAYKNLPNNSKILTTHRAYSLSKNSFISYDFRLYSSTQEELDYYLDLILKKKPTHILYNGNDHDNSKDFLKNCRGKLAARGKNVHQVNKRNPFNLRIIQHDVYIYEIDLNKLKKCKIK